MAGERTLPGAGLTGFWTAGSSGWGGQNDVDLRTTSAVMQLAVESATSSLPGSPSDGVIYIVPSGADAKKIAVRDNGAWAYINPWVGVVAWVKDSAKFVYYSNSLAWTDFPPPNLSGYQPISAKGQASGYASLDSGTKVPTAQIPDLSATYQIITAKGAASGYASLDSGTKVPTAQIPDLSATYQVIADKAVANGYASLDSSGKVPAGQLDLSSVVGGLTPQGTWNASTNTPTIPAASSGNHGWYYIVSVDGTTAVDGVSDWAAGDWIVSNGTVWQKIDNTDKLSAVAGLTGSPTMSALLDTISSTRGTILYRGAGGWVALAPGTSGYRLTSGGSGADPSWTAVITALTSSDVATSAQYLADTADKLLDTDGVWTSAVPVVLVDGANVVATSGDTTLDFSKFINAKVTLGGNRTLPTPSNVKPGQSGDIEVIQDGTGSRTLTLGSNYVTTGGAGLGTLSTTAGTRDVVSYKVLADSKVWVGLAKALS